MYYIVVCGESVEGIYSDFEEALRKGMLCRSRSVTIMRGAVVIKLEEDELRVLSRLLRSEAVGEEREREGLVVVFDQMFKGFAEIIHRELAGEELELHEIVGRGLEKPLRVGRVVKEPAQDDYDVLKLLESLASSGRKVVFFTGDKKLAHQASSLEGVVVEYLPPGEFTGKEAAIKVMIDKLKRLLGKTSS